MPHIEAPLLCKYSYVTHKEAIVSPVIKKCILVLLIYYFVPHKICCASHWRCHGATLCDSLHYTTLPYPTLHYNTLHYTTLPYPTLHYTTPPQACEVWIYGLSWLMPDYYWQHWIDPILFPYVLPVTQIALTG